MHFFSCSPLSPPVVVSLIEPEESTPLDVVGFFGQHVTCPNALYNGTDWVQCDLCKVWVHTSWGMFHGILCYSGKIGVGGGSNHPLSKNVLPGATYFLWLPPTFE